jgi:hypothetical protein
MTKINFLLIVFFLLVSCGTLKDAGKVLRNEKVITTDEFLVKKRNPLILPPDFENIPEPGSISKDVENEEEKIKKILKAPENRSNSKTKPSSAEQSILNRIRK